MINGVTWTEPNGLPIALLARDDLHGTRPVAVYGPALERSPEQQLSREQMDSLFEAGAECVEDYITERFTHARRIDWCRIVVEYEPATLVTYEDTNEWGDGIGRWYVTASQWVRVRPLPWSQAGGPWTWLWRYLRTRSRVALP